MLPSDRVGVEGGAQMNNDKGDGQQISIHVGT
jgi:hypothetical protein